MQTIWFCILSVMLTIYVVLDGFDFGAGILHLLVAKTDEERRTVLAAIGPVWDGNEVWLLASGGVLVFSFPRAYSAGFSGFYMPLMIVLWLLIIRGVSIEFRSKEENPLWRSFWDGAFFFASTLLAIVLGAALGNVIRGVPVDQTGFFTGPLFTNFRLGANPGVLDWFTVLVGVFTLLVLAGHGALYLNMKTEGEIQNRAKALAKLIWTGVVLVGILATAATMMVRPEIFRNILDRPWVLILVALIPGSLMSLFMSLRGNRETPAFLSSVCFIISMLAATASGLYPNLLISTLDRRFDINVYNASAGKYGLEVGLVWWILAIILTTGYFIYLFRAFQGKAHAGSSGHGY
jgi:cytochrome d ubiquinol oxidase subunit II